MYRKEMTKERIEKSWIRTEKGMKRKRNGSRKKSNETEMKRERWLDKTKKAELRIRARG